MAVRPFEEITPTIDESAYVDEQSSVIGDVHIGADSSIWPMAVLRGDVNKIRIGARTSIQDGTVGHVTHDHPGEPGGHPLVVGDDVTVGHNVTLHGCTIGNKCLVGMGSTVLDGAVLEDGVFLAADSLVPPGKTLEGGYLWVGSPVKKARPLNNAEKEWLSYSAQHYARLKDKYRK